ncbi:MAG TPA: cytochrome ubiquinol oxidase subunit I [Ktedonobacteraceae bacterium]|jgi:cytochrome d ubiquinol oxidase subunit I|nr:cytochrome ubiquinol oxidase subunit I [Ktedonobacteraceae bacterium]
MWSNLLAARTQMGTSLGFHIIFAALGVGLPLALCVAEGLALWNSDGTWMALAHQWARAFTFLFAIGAVSGAIIEFELALLWPTFIKYSGAIIGLPFALEGFAFFLEGIFLGIYLYGARRLSPLVHWLSSLVIVLSGLSSAWFVVSANSWMNTPAGFHIAHGKITGIDPYAAMLNPSTPYETAHMILACYVVAGFGIASVYAMGMLRGKRDAYHRKGLLLGMAIGTAAIPFQILTGDFNARQIETVQPPKYAAMEGLLHSGYGRPLYIGGFVDTRAGKVLYALVIPHGESLLAHFNLNSFSIGLDRIPKSEWPANIPFIHLAFDGMVFCSFYMLAIGVLFMLPFIRRQFFLSQPRIPERRWLLGLAVLTGPAAILAMELGWMVTEFGRQPWIIYKLLLTKNAVTPAMWMNVTFLVFACIYVLLGITLIILLLQLARRPKPPQVWPELVRGASTAGSQAREGATER